MPKKRKNTTIKTTWEINILKENAKIHKEIFDRIKDMVRPWITGLDIDRLCGDIAKSHNVLCGFKWVYDFPGNICINVNDCVVHGFPNDTPFKEWDKVTFDFGIKDKKYGLNTDRAFTMIVWEWPHDPKLEHFLKITKEAMYKGIEQAKDGARVWDIWYAIQTHIEKNWYYVVKDFTWHGIWYNLHELPYITNYGQRGKWPILKENMVICIEPIVWYSTDKFENRWFPVYMADGGYGAQFEHQVVIRKSWAEILI